MIKYLDDEHRERAEKKLEEDPEARMRLSILTGLEALTKIRDIPLGKPVVASKAFGEIVDLADAAIEQMRDLGAPLRPEVAMPPTTEEELYGDGGGVPASGDAGTEADVYPPDSADTHAQRADGLGDGLEVLADDKGGE